MESVIVSIKPEWIEKIVSGEKTIEVRKSAPKEVPFKCYIYCTKAKGVDLCKSKTDIYINRLVCDDIKKINGKVIGEFICNKVSTYIPLGVRGFEEVSDNTLAKMCLSKADLDKYGGLKTLYGWHISDLKIYDKPRELSEFKKPCPNDDDTLCIYCDKSGYTPDMEIECFNTITRPPQSWMFVEEVIER